MEQINNKILKECSDVASLDELFEAMSPEDRRDTDLIASVQRKIAARSNARLTPEEQAVLDKYGIIRHDKYLSIPSKTDPGGYYNRSVIRTPDEESPLKGKHYWGKTNKPNEVNLADIARKRGQRFDRDVLKYDSTGRPVVIVGQSRRRVKKEPDDHNHSFHNDERTNLERGALNDLMQLDVLDMKRSIGDRNYSEKEASQINDRYRTSRQNLDDKYFKDIENLEKSRLYDIDYHSRRINSNQDIIDNILNKYRSKK